MLTKIKKDVKGLAKVARESQKIDFTSGKSQWEMRVPVYYSIDTQTLYTTPGNDDREHICDLLNPCSEDEVLNALNRWIWM